MACDESVEATLSSTEYLLASLESGISNSTSHIRALVLKNPHNPFGRCYRKDMLALCAQFCERHNIHFISDEVYALLVFVEDDTEISSALQLDLEALKVDPDRVQVIWSTSKDFGLSGPNGCHRISSQRTLTG